jgi:hypothetical protein
MNRRTELKIAAGAVAGFVLAVALGAAGALAAAGRTTSFDRHESLEGGMPPALLGAEG